MDDELRAKIANDLKRSGFHSEMVVVQTFVSRGWECRRSFTYLDMDSGVSRECDFEAVRSVKQLRPSDSLALQRFVIRILGEVKKSDRPWIVFKDPPAASSELFDTWDNIIVEANLPGDQLRLAKPLSAKSPFSANGWRTSGMHEFEKKPSDKSVWYSAFITSCKATESALDSFVSEADPASSQKGVCFDLFKPLVVLDGTLVAAEMSEGGELILSEIDSAAFRFEYRSREYGRRHYCLDLVTLAGLSAYLRMTEERLSDFLAAVQWCHEEDSRTEGGR